MCFVWKDVVALTGFFDVFLQVPAVHATKSVGDCEMTLDNKSLIASVKSYVFNIEDMTAAHLHIVSSLNDNSCFVHKMTTLASSTARQTKYS